MPACSSFTIKLAQNATRRGDLVAINYTIFLKITLSPYPRVTLYKDKEQLATGHMSQMSMRILRSFLRILYNTSMLRNKMFEEAKGKGDKDGND